jgi:hypothetical protein
MRLLFDEIQDRLVVNEDNWLIRNIFILISFLFIFKSVSIEMLLKFLIGVIDATQGGEERGRKLAR